MVSEQGHEKTHKDSKETILAKIEDLKKEIARNIKGSLFIIPIQAHA